MRSLHYPLVSDVIEVNRNVTKLTGDEHSIDEYDKGRLSKLLSEVQNVGDAIIDPGRKIAAKASYLLYHIAAGQFFHEGNKRTAYTVAMAFLGLNGYVMPARDSKREKIARPDSSR